MTPLRTALLTMAAMAAFASNSLLCRAGLAGGHADAASFTGIRLIGGATLLAVVARARSSPRPTDDVAWTSALALFAYAIGFSFAYLRVNAGVGALLLFAAVQLTMIGAGLRAGERPRLVEWLGLGLSIAGLLVLTRPGLARPDVTGSTLMLAAGIAWGVYSLRGRRAVDAVSANASSFSRAALLALVAIVFATARGAIHIDRTGLLLALASGGLASGVGYMIWYAALRGLTATRAAIVQLSVPPLTAAGGVVILGERFSPRLITASLLILGGIALATVAHGRMATRVTIDSDT